MGWPRARSFPTKIGRILYFCQLIVLYWHMLLGETANSIQPPERSCNSQEPDKLCNEKTCFSCNSVREANSQTVRGTILVRETLLDYKLTIIPKAAHS